MKITQEEQSIQEEQKEVDELYNAIVTLLKDKTPVISLNALVRLASVIAISCNSDTDKFIDGVRSVYESLDKYYGDDFRRGGRLMS